MKLFALAGLCLLAHAAQALAPVVAGERPFTLTAGEAGGTGDHLSAELGWPAVALGYTHPLSTDLDIGARLDLLYGVETSADVTHFGTGLRIPVRATVWRQDRLSLLLHVDPGLKYYAFSPAQLGLGLPLGGQLGLRLADGLWITAAVDVPMTLFFAGVGGAAFTIGLQPGFAVEYALDKQIGLSLDTRFGPVFSASYFGSSPVFGFRTQVGLSYRL